jgi:hypothetical protein
VDTRFEIARVVEGAGSMVDRCTVYAYSVMWLVLTVNNISGDVNLESLFVRMNMEMGYVLSTTSLSSEVS